MSPRPAPTKNPAVLRRRARGRCSRAAYTILEVMMALAVLSIGATGVIAMQKAALLGNVRARDLATASTLASSWMERLRVDGLQWTITINNMSTIGNTTWLNVVQNDFPNVTGLEGQWFAPSTVSAGMGYEDGADLHGYDTADTEQHGFCVNLRLTQILPNLIRAEVRIFWLRRQGGGVIAGVTEMCDPSPAYLQNLSLIDSLPIPDPLSHYHFVYLTSAIIQHDDN